MIYHGDNPLVISFRFYVDRFISCLMRLINPDRLPAGSSGKIMVYAYVHRPLEICHVFSACAGGMYTQPTASPMW